MPSGPEPTPAHREGGALLDLRQHRLTSRFTARKSELAYRLFDLTKKRNRWICCIGTSLLVSTPHTLIELFNPSASLVSSFGGLALQACPGVAAQHLVFTLLFRYVLVGLIGATCYTRFNPMRKSYDLVACIMISCVILSKIIPSMRIVLLDTAEHDQLCTNETFQFTPSSAKIATEEMTAWSCFSFVAAVSGMSPLSYLAATSVSAGVWWLHSDLCWNYFFGDAPDTLWQGVCVSLLGLFGSIVLDNTARHRFVLRVRLESTIEQLSREKQRLTQDLRLLPTRKPDSPDIVAAVTPSAVRNAQLESAFLYDATQSETDADECVGTAAPMWRNSLSPRSPRSPRSKHGSETDGSDSDLQATFVPVENHGASPATPSSEMERGTVCWQTRSPASASLFGDRPLRHTLANRLAALSSQLAASDLGEKSESPCGIFAHHQQRI